MMASRLRRRGLAFLLVLALAGAPGSGLADDGGDSMGREGGLGAAAALSSLVYAPVKLLYATGGLVIGGFAWAFTAGDSEVATSVFTRSVRGTYVITPEMLTGEVPVAFIGRSTSPRRTEPAAVASAPPPEPAPSDGYDDIEMGW